ncbi:hypothetical protein LXL04_032751 [Taraxacum kok-saghyz]
MALCLITQLIHFEQLMVRLTPKSKSTSHPSQSTSLPSQSASSLPQPSIELADSTPTVATRSRHRLNSQIQPPPSRTQACSRHSIAGGSSSSEQFQCQFQKSGNCSRQFQFQFQKPGNRQFQFQFQFLKKEARFGRLADVAYTKPMVKFGKNDFSLSKSFHFSCSIADFLK